MNSKYRFIEKCGAGAFSDVIKAEQIATGKIVAIKRLKQHCQSVAQVTSMREVQALKMMQQCQAVAKIIEILYDQKTGKLAFVFEFYDCCLYDLIKGKKDEFNTNQLKWYLFQICNSLLALHKAGLMHRDLKPENYLVQKVVPDNWMGDVIRLSDLGSSRQFVTANQLPLTEYISTRWYRAPEIILSDGFYGHESDIFALGCLLFEIAQLKPLFPGSDEGDQLSKIHNVTGTPDADLLKRLRSKSQNNPLLKMNFKTVAGKGLPSGLDDLLADLILRTLTYDPAKRFTAAQVLTHPYFDDMETVFSRIRAVIPSQVDYVNYCQDQFCQVREEERLSKLREHRSPSATRPLNGSVDHGQVELPTIAKKTGKKWKK